MMRSFLTPLIACALLLPAPVAAQQYLNVRDADIRAFVEDASRVTGRTFIVDSSVEGTVSVVTERPLSRAEYFEVFLSTLRANGFVAIPLEGGALRITRAADAARQPDRGGGDRFVTRVIPLRTVDAASALEAVAPLVSTDGQVSASASGNALVVADFEDNLARIRGVLAEIDRDRSSMELISLENAGAREIAQAVGQIIAAGGEAGVAVVPVDSANALILRGDPSRIQSMASIVRQLDSRAALGADVRVHYLEHADAEFLLPVLQQIAGQTLGVSAPVASASDEAPAGSVQAVTAGSGNSRAVIARYEGANAIIISAPPDIQRALGEVILQLDVRRQQVLVEAIIAEVSDLAARQLGVQFLLAGTDGTVPFAVTNYSNSAPNSIAVAGGLLADQLESEEVVVDGEIVTRSGSSALVDQLQQAAAASLLGIQGGLFGVGGQEGDTLFGAIINAVKSDTSSNLLQVPSLMTLDNQEARFLVGQEIPITTGETLSPNFDNAFRTVERQNVGILLEVRPQINAGGAVKLHINQEVSSIAGPVSTNSSDLVLNTREIETTVTVDDGDIVALGALLNDAERRTIEKIPLLGDIPLLGELFKSRSRSRENTSLMVFIRPRIVKTRADAQEVAAQKYGYIRSQQQARDPDIEPSLDRVLRDYLATVPPVALPAAGARFRVEAAAFPSLEEAEAAAIELAVFGPAEVVQRAGTNVVALGPMPSYEAAEIVRQRLAAGGYVDAQIVEAGSQTVTRVSQ